MISVLKNVSDAKCDCRTGISLRPKVYRILPKRAECEVLLKAG